ncbi:hypothetical protein, partial [Proteus vulgaris]|uniref:hypothetical protein n=1 Tax=Proteus vulgaris TaxID=585 RepID=UPI001954EBE2
LRAVSATQDRIFIFENFAYARMIEEGLDVLKRMGRPTDQRVFALEFANPYPMLLNRPPLKGALLWLHDGTTFNGANTKMLDPI